MFIQKSGSQCIHRYLLLLKDKQSSKMRGSRTEGCFFKEKDEFKRIVQCDRDI